MTYKITGTHQELFDEVCVHLDRQGHRAGFYKESRNFYCRYRAPNGDRCAIGCLIPDSEYNRDMECHAFSELISGNLLTSTNSNIRLLTELQEAHDLCTSWKNIKSRLIKVGMRFDLNLNVLSSLPFTPKEYSNAL